MGERIVFQQVESGQPDICTQKKEVGPLPHTMHKIKFRWIEDLTITAKSIKLLEKNINVNLCYLGISNGFLDRTPEAQAIK